MIEVEAVWMAVEPLDMRSLVHRICTGPGGCRDCR